VRFSKRQCAALAVAMVMACSVAPVFAGGAGADALTDKQAEARQISERMSALDVQMEQLAEQYNQTRLQLDDVQGQIDDATARLARTNDELARHRAELASYAVTAYVKGGESDLPDLLLKGSGSDVNRQIEYLQVASSSRRQLIDDVRGAQHEVDAQLADLRSTRTKAEQLQADLDKRRADTKRASDEQSKLMARVTGELGVLVDQAQAQQAVADEAAARARLEATPPPTTPDPAVPPGPGAPPTAKTPPTTKPGDPPTTTPTTPPTTVPPTTVPVLWPVPPGPPPPVLPQAAAVVALAKTQLGVPYLWGGDNPKDGFDCSGLMLWAWRVAGGRTFVHSAELQARATRRINFSDLQPGDMLFYGAPVHHVGMYVGGGQMIEAPHTGAFVRIASIWRTDLVAAGRVT
jgi:cell wall-associated NlpC family hydrolase